MNFNPDPGKQAQEVIFSRKTQKENYPLLFFNWSSIIQATSQIHLEIHNLIVKNTFKHCKVSKIASLLKSLKMYYIDLHCSQFSKTFLQPPHDYDVKKLEMLQYNSALAVTGVIRDISREKNYHQLGLYLLETLLFL